MLFRTTILAALLLSVAACSNADYMGPPPDADAIYFPVGMALHPSGQYLYVANANFDALYRSDRGGTIMVIDTETLRVLPETTWEIGSFAAGVLINRGRPGTDVPDRLYVAVRGDDSVVALNLSEDGSTLNCPNAGDDAPNALSCRVRRVGSEPFGMVQLPAAEHLDSQRDQIAVASLSGRISVFSLAGDSSRLQVSDALVSQAVGVSGASVIRYLERTNEIWMGGRFSQRLRGFTPVPKFRSGESEPMSTGALSGIAITSEAALPSLSTGTEVRDMVFTDDGRTAWVAMGSPASLIRFEMNPDGPRSSRAIPLDRIDLEGHPSALLATRQQGRELLYVANPGRGAISVHDAQTGLAQGQIQLDGYVYSMVADEDAQILYVAIFDRHSVVAVDINPRSPSFHQVVRRTP